MFHHIYVLVFASRYVVLWKEIDGKWHLHYDIFNSDNPKEKGW